MSGYRIGRNIANGTDVVLPLKALPTHVHLIGGTGSGKSTLLVRLLSQVFLSIVQKSTVFVIDPLGGLADALLTLLAHPTLCTKEARERVVYIEPANIDSIMPFNMLLFSDENDLYYRTGRASDVMLRSGRSHDMALQLRLRRWLYNSFYSIGAIGLPPAAAQFLVHPGTDQHRQLINMIPPQLQLEWGEILNAGTRDRINMLDSTRNRLSPFFACPSLNYMLSCNESKFDVPRFMREKKIVIINLAPKGKLDPHVANAMGGLMINEIIQTARNSPRELVNPTMLVIDEFQNYVGDDLYRALPETRQLGLQLVLSHQSFSQLENGEIDMRGIVWQLRNRFMFASDAEDADLLAMELASLNYDPKKLKDQIEVFRQKKVGQDIVRLNNFNATSTQSNASDKSCSTSRSKSKSGDDKSESTGESQGASERFATSDGSSEGWSETLVDRLEDFYEVSSRTYYTFEEQMRCWARDMRRLETGKCLAKFKDDNNIYHTDVDFVSLPLIPALRDLKQELIEKNFANRELFLPTTEVKQRWLDFVQRLGEGKIIAPHQQAILDAKVVGRLESKDDSSFR